MILRKVKQLKIQVISFLRFLAIFALRCMAIFALFITIFQLRYLRSKGFFVYFTSFW
jgi:hypothetical protein